MDPKDNPSYSFTDEDQQEQLQIFVDWLHSQRVNRKGFSFGLLVVYQFSTLSPTVTLTLTLSLNPALSQMSVALAPAASEQL